MQDFDELSFKLELADLLDKYDVQIESDAVIGFYHTTSFIEYDLIVTPKELRKMTTDYRTIYSSTKERLLKKHTRYFAGWEKHTEPEMFFYGLRWKMIIKKTYTNG